MCKPKRGGVLFVLALMVTYSHRGSNSRPSACEADVITNYTMQACFPREGEERETKSTQRASEMHTNTKGRASENAQQFVHPMRGLNPRPHDNFTNPCGIV